MKKLKYKSFVASIFLFSLSSANALDNEKAHVHGIADLFVATENQLIDINFQSPAVNLVGFESIALTEEEKKHAESIYTLLSDPYTVFDIDSGVCEIQSMKVDFSSVLTLEDSHKEHDHEEHNHEEHDHEEHDHEKNNHKHSDIELSYRFQCEIDESTELNTAEIFRNFPSLHKINYTVISNKLQVSGHLTKNNTQLSLF